MTHHYHEGTNTPPRLTDAQLAQGRADYRNSPAGAWLLPDASNVGSGTPNVPPATPPPPAPTLRTPDQTALRIEHRATAILALAMEDARRNNPRGDLYRGLSQKQLWRMLRQNLDELKIALKYGNDVPDKFADVGNFLAFMLDLWLDPPTQEEIDAALAREAERKATELLRNAHDPQRAQLDVLGYTQRRSATADWREYDG